MNVAECLWADEVRESVTIIGQHVRIAGAGLGSYDPSVGLECKTAEVAVKYLESISRRMRRMREGGSGKWYPSSQALVN